MHKITIYSLLFIFVVSCSGTFDSVKRGLTGSKSRSADEFLVKKKDPLILPPDFESLPTPDDKVADVDANSIFKKTLEPTDEEKLSGPQSTENSILKKIQSK
tara:strand:- start:148 stop:453 length:306 start_codon:yes stop_codon:yes gene_type:complete